MDYALKKTSETESSIDRSIKQYDKPAIGVYISTDTGVYLLRESAAKNSSWLEGAQRVSLPGVSGMCMAMTCFAAPQGNSYLWVSDLSGDGYLFWDKQVAKSRWPNWRRSGISIRDAQVLRAFSFWHEEKKALIVGQAGRNDRIILSRYTKRDPDGERDHDQGLENQLRDILARTSFTNKEEERYKKFLHFLEAMEDSLPPGNEIQQWRPASQLAALFERIREQKNLFEALIEFLGNPNEKLAISILDAEFPNKTDEKMETKLTLIIDLWTQALLGAIQHSAFEKKESHCLGVIRWLRKIGKYGDLGSDDNNRALRDAVSKNIMFVRKWGVFGDTYEKRKSVNKPLEILDEQGDESRLLDRIIYRSILFNKCVDLEFDAALPEESGRTAWDLQILHMPKALVVAVSWIWGGIDLYTIVCDDQTGGPSFKRLYNFEPLEIETDKGDTWALRAKKVTEERTAPIAKKEYGYSRAVILGRFKSEEKKSDDFFLMASPAQASEPHGGKRKPKQRKTASPSLYLWPFRVDAPDHVTLLDRSLEPPEEGEDKANPAEYGVVENIKHQVFSLLELEPQLILAGLEGTGGGARLQLIKIRGGQGNKLAVSVHNPEPQSLPSVSPKRKNIERNQVWALARDSFQKDSSETEHEAIAGCADGQVWRLRLPKLDDGAPETFKMTPKLIERLSAPVWALAFRKWRRADDPNPIMRVFAGSSDGDIVAWQSLPDKEDSDPKYAVLWATMEKRAIARIHAFDYTPDGEGEKLPMVMAVTQRGRAILFNDRAKVEETNERKDDWKKQRRRHVPGQRHGRLKLGTTAFATAIVNQERMAPYISAATEGTSSESPFRQADVRMAIASGSGALQCATFHNLPYTDQRKTQYQELMKQWIQAMKNASSERFLPYQLRVSEATYGVNATFSLTLIRWILGFGGKESINNSLPKGEPQLQWIPSHLRSLLELSEIWNSQKKKSAGNIIGKLERALKKARSLNDTRLFKEIVSIVLNIANHRLYDLGDINDKDMIERELEIYGHILAELEKTGNLWLGASDNQDAKVRMVIAKNIMDGETLWRLAIHSWQNDTPAHENNISALFGEALQKRARQVRLFLDKGETLLALETLRACNLSMLRAAKRLDDARRQSDRDAPLEPKALGAAKKDIPPELEVRQIPWEGGVESFFTTIGDFASRIFHAEGGPGPALAHEIARVYALGVAICPDAASLLAIRMSEASPPKDILKRTTRQITLLTELGIKIPEPAAKLFKMAISVTWSETEGLTFANQTLRDWLDLKTGKEPDSEASPLKQDIDWKADIHKPALQRILGAVNGAVVFYYMHYEQIVRWLDQLTHKLSRDVRDINLWKAEPLLVKIEKLEQGWRQSHSLNFKENYPFYHTHDFWRTALGQLKQLLEKFNIDKTHSPSIRPELALISIELANWCNKMMDELDRRQERHGIFEPEYTIWTGCLKRLEFAAEKFRRSSAIQKNIVLGVLGHGLLGTLDEHIFEMEEVAQALDPYMVWQYRDQSGSEKRVDIENSGGSTTRNFARYLLQRSRNAESVPKNLRTLQGMLDETIEPGEKSTEELNTLFEEIEPNESLVWKAFNDSENANYKISSNEMKFLRLTLNELNQNNRAHGPSENKKPQYFIFDPAQSDDADGERKRVIEKITELRRKLSDNASQAAEEEAIELKNVVGQAVALILFRIDETKKENLERLKDLKDKGLEELINPLKKPDVPSHGTGLYLANLAAAAVGWKLSIAHIEPVWLWFALWKVDKQPADGNQGRNHG